MQVTVLGIGAMGQRMAKRLLSAGFTVQVWNRDAEKAKPLLAAGARWRDTPADAVASADVVISMLRDDEASRSVWLAPETGALAGLAAQAIVVECASLTISWVQELAQAVSSHGLGFLDAPVVGSRPQAEAGTLIHLVGGSAEHLELVRPVLAVLGSAQHHMGPVGSGAAMKLLVNMLFASQVSAAAEALGWAQRQHLNPKLVSSTMSQLPVCSAAMKAALDSMADRAFAPLFTVALVEKDLSYFVKEARRCAVNTPLADTTHAVMQQGLAEGLAEYHLTAVAQMYDT